MRLSVSCKRDDCFSHCNCRSWQERCPFHPLHQTHSLLWLTLAAAPQDGESVLKANGQECWLQRNPRPSSRAQRTGGGGCIVGHSGQRSVDALSVTGVRGQLMHCRSQWTEVSWCIVGHSGQRSVDALSVTVVRGQLMHCRSLVRGQLMHCRSQWTEVNWRIVRHSGQSSTDGLSGQSGQRSVGRLSGQNGERSIDGLSGNIVQFLVVWVIGSHWKQVSCRWSGLLGHSR